MQEMQQVVINLFDSRLQLATLDQVLEHQPGTGQQAFSYFKRTKSYTGGKPGSIETCTTYFVSQDTVDTWNQAVLDTSTIEGRLACPKCDSKIGSYHLAGTQCSCGSWVAPAFCIQKGKVDTFLAMSMG
ncbi:hypothetical protein BDV3_001266 [Batrachochytrium dendrobatidis]